MARANFGQTTADFVSDTIGGGLMRLRSADLHFSDDAGNQVTDLILNGTPVTHIPVDSTGIIPQFQGPDGVYKLWAQADVQSGRQALVAITDATDAAVAAAASIDTAHLVHTDTRPQHAPSLGLYFPEAEGAVGDGTADDTAALQAAFNACSATGGRVLLGIGKNYKTTASLAWPAQGQVVGAGRGKSTVTYTGSGTAITMHDPGTAEVKANVYAADFTLSAASAAVGINAKGAGRAVIERVEVFGASTAAGIVSASVGILLDGSYSGSIGAWWNHVRNCYLNGWDAGVKLTGVDNAGQPNENYIEGNRIGLCTRGVWIDQGDHVTVRDNDLTSTVTNCVGIYVQDEGARLVNNRFESVKTAIQLIGADTAHSAGGRRTQIRENIFSSGTSGAVAIQLDASAGAGGSAAPTSTYIGANYYLSTITRIVDNSANGTDLTQLARYTDQTIVPYHFAASPTAVSTTYNPAAMGGGANDLPFPGRPFQVRGISARTGSARTAGTLTIKPKVSGTASTTLSATIDGTNTQTTKMFQGMGKDANVGTGSIGVQVVSDASWAPTASQTVYVTVWVEFTD